MSEKWTDVGLRRLKTEQTLSASDIGNPVRHAVFLPQYSSFVCFHYTLLFTSLHFHVLSQALNLYLLSICTHSPLVLTFE